MANTETQLGPGSAVSLLAGLDSAVEVSKPKAAQPESQAVEPTMRALRRILGEDVLDIFPEGFTDLIDGLYEAHSQDSEKWSEAEYDSADERNDALALMRAYAECAGETGYTIRQDRTASAETLRFRVIPRKGSKKAAQEGDGE